jgi:hypothetical protein
VSGTVRLASCCCWPSDGDAAAAAAASRAPASVSTGLGGPDMVPPGQEKSRRVRTARWRGERPARAALLGRKERNRRAERCSAGRRGADARSAARQGGSVKNRGQARSRDTMREYESWDSVPRFCSHHFPHTLSFFYVLY